MSYLLTALSYHACACDYSWHCWVMPYTCRGEQHCLISILGSTVQTQGYCCKAGERFPGRRSASPGRALHELRDRLERHSGGLHADILSERRSEPRGRQKSQQSAGPAATQRSRTASSYHRTAKHVMREAKRDPGGHEDQAGPDDTSECDTARDMAHIDSRLLALQKFLLSAKEQ